jgi:hypothetical protein
MMRFRGGGVGHKSTREATDFFRSDRDRLDKETVTAAQIDEDDDDAGYCSGTENLEDEEEDYGYIQDDTDSQSEDENGVDDILETFGYADL